MMPGEEVLADGTVVDGLGNFKGIDQPAVQAAGIDQIANGDTMRLANLRHGEIVDVTVVEVLRGKGLVIVEDNHGPKPRRRWTTGVGFLLPQQVESGEEQ